MNKCSKIYESVSKQERTKAVEAIRHQIRCDWKNLWDNRIHDSSLAEDVASTNYDLLFIEKGTIIKATKDYRPPNLENIFERNEKLLDVSFSPLNPKVGGWRKFSRDILSKQPRWSKASHRIEESLENNKNNCLAKKGSRGWLHKF